MMSTPPRPRDSITFSISGKTLDEMREKAREQLVGFLGFEPPFTLDVNPLIEIQSAEGNSVGVWTATVNASVVAEEGRKF